VFNVLFVGYSLAKNNLNNTYQYNMLSKKNSKTMNYVLNYINKIQSESFFVPVSVVLKRTVFFFFIQ
jgi:disulfide oxidoreductase YuzD